MSGPLNNLLVVAVEQAVAAPLCTARLADAGARVIKVERHDGDFARRYDSVVHGESAYFVWLNRGKESVILDIKQPADLVILRRMIGQSDVFVQNLAPGAARRAGLSSEELRALNPRLITCDIRGYSGAGPYSERKAYDLIIQCETALVAVSGDSATEGARVGVSVADICCGMNAHARILQALIDRQRTGYGESISVSLFDGLADWMTVPLLYQEYTGEPPPRIGINHSTIAPYGVYTTGDGGKFILSVQNEREWNAFCTTVLRKTELAKDPRFLTNAQRCVNRPALSVLMLHAFQSLTGAELADRLAQANVAFGTLNSVADFAKHPHLRRIRVETPSGPVDLPAPSLMDGDEAEVPRKTPALGADSERIRKEFA